MEYNYDWLFDAKWEEIATLLMCMDEDDPLFWFQHKKQEWADMLRLNIDGMHYGDCTKVPMTCLRCLGEDYYAKVAALKAILRPSEYLQESQ